MKYLQNVYRPLCRAFPGCKNAGDPISKWFGGKRQMGQNREERVAQRVAVTRKREKDCGKVNYCLREDLRLLVWELQVSHLFFDP